MFSYYKITVNTCLKAVLCFQFSVFCAIIEILYFIWVSLTFYIEIKLFPLSHRLTAWYERKPTTLYVPVDLNLDTVTDNQTIALNVGVAISGKPL